MKKIVTLTALFIAGSFIANAQRTVGGISTEFASKSFSGNVNKADTTVVVPESFNETGCDTLIVYTVPSNGGYVSGFNTYGDLEKAQLNFGSGQVLGVFASIAGKVAAPLAACGALQFVEGKVGDRCTLFPACDMAVGDLDDGSVQAVKSVQHHFTTRAEQGGERLHGRFEAGDQVALFIGQRTGLA